MAFDTSDTSDTSDTGDTGDTEDAFDSGDTDDTDDTDYSGDSGDYDEFALLGDNATEAGLSLTAPPRVARVSFEVKDGPPVSALAWGDAEPELVLLHGGGQN